MIEEKLPKSIEILRLLNHFRVLTIPMMMRLGVSQNANSLHNILDKIPTRMYYDDELEEKRRKKKQQPARPHMGQKNFYWFRKQRPAMFCLEKWGAKRLQDTIGAEEVEELHYKAHNLGWLEDYQHRVNTVAFHVELHLFCQQYNCKELFFHTYFDKSGYNRNSPLDERLRSLTRIEIDEHNAVTPDVVFAIENPQGQRALFAGEMYNGIRTKRTVQQLKKHLDAAAVGAVARAYNMALPCRRLVFFDTEEAMRAVYDRVREDPVFAEFEEIEELLAFNYLEAVQKSFYDNWLFFDGTRKAIF